MTSGHHDIRQPDPAGTLWGLVSSAPAPAAPPSAPAPAKAVAPMPAPHNGTRGSQAAAEAVEGRRLPQWERIFNAVDAAGMRGLTRNEIAARCGLLIQSVCARVAELTAPAADGGFELLIGLPQSGSEEERLVSRKNWIRHEAERRGAAMKGEP